MILKRIIIPLLCLLSGFCCYGQVSVVPSNTNACICSGSMTFTASLAVPSNYTLYDASGGILTTAVSATGSFNINGLCPEAYLLEVIQNNVTTIYYFNIPTVTLNPGDAIFQSVCSTDGVLNLNQLLNATDLTGNWMDPSFQIISNLINANTMTDGWYTYALPSNGCLVTSGIYVDFIQNADPGNTTTYLICEDYVTFFMTNLMAGTPDPYGQWFNVAGNPVSGFYDPATMNSQLFTYMIDTVVGCGPVFATMNVVENQIPDVGLDASIIVCQGGVSFNMINYLGGNPQGGGTWYNPANVPVSGIFNPATYAEGTYRYHLNGLVPCVDQNAFLTITYITENPSGESASFTACESGNNVNMLNALNGSPLAGGNWTSPQGLAVDGVYNPQTEPPGDYLYYYPNVGCVPQGVVLTINLETIPDAGNDNQISLCESATSINLNSLLSPGADAGGTWADASGNSIGANFIFPGNSNSYDFIYHVNGLICPDDNAGFEIVLVPEPTIPPNTSLVLCSEENPVDLHNLYPLFPNIIFENPNGTIANPLFNPDVNGSMVITAIEPSQNSCPNAEAIVEITVTYPLFVVDSLFYEICQSQLEFDLTNVSTIANNSIGFWYDEFQNQIATDVALDFLGERNFTFIANNNSTCGENQLTVAVESFSFTEAGPSATAVFCNSDDPELLIDLLPNSANVAGAWQFNGSAYAFDNVDPAVNVTGSFLYVVPANGPCPSDAAELFVTIEQGILYDAGEDVEACAGSNSIQLGETPLINTTYSWSPSINLSNANSAFPFVSFEENVVTTQSTEYYIVIDDGICTAYDTILVMTYPLPIIYFNDLYEVCIGENLNLEASPGYNYIWSPGFLFSDNSLASQNILPQQNVEVTLVASTDNGCQASATTDIVVHPLPIIYFSPENSASCSPLDVEFYLDSNSVNVNEVLWSIPGVGNFNEDTLNTTLYETGNYSLSLTAISDFGCSTSLSFNNVMEVYEKTIADFYTEPSELTTIDPIANFIDECVNAVNYDWTFDIYGNSHEASPVFEFPNEDPDNFEVCLLVTSEHGCRDNTCRILHLDNQYIFFAPNAITPDDDGINDVFQPVMEGFDLSTYSLSIFDRWGERIYFTKEYSAPWTGNLLNGTYYVQEDVYTWMVQIKDKEMAEYKVYKGFVTVVR